MTLQRWERVTGVPLSIVALVFLAAYSWQVIGELHGTADAVANAVIWITWGVFAVDYLVELWLARPKWRWFYTHLFDLAIVVLPMLRPLRLVRLVVVLKLFQHSAVSALRGRIVLYAAAGAMLLVYVTALAELDAERGHGGPIQNFGESLWWAFVTMTTVGYGDYDPVTVAGRLIAVLVMIGGVSLLGVVTATIASWIVERVAQEGERSEAATKAHIDEVLRELSAVRSELAELRQLHDPPGPRDSMGSSPH